MPPLICSTHTKKELLQEVKELLSNKDLKPRSILCVNAHIYNLAYKNEWLRTALNAARIVAVDGFGIVLAAKWLNIKLKERCNMTETFREFLSNNMPKSKGIIIGCSDMEAKAAAQRANEQSRHCEIINSFSGYLNNEEYKQILKNHQDIDFVFLGMGTPRTEEIADLAGKICPKSIIWHIGGGTILIYAEEIQEAPIFLRKMGLQWLYRLIQEPAKLWKRYLIGIPLFLWRVLLKKRAV